jgi:GT2 family glycosyltransferase
LNPSRRKPSSIRSRPSWWTTIPRTIRWRSPGNCSADFPNACIVRNSENLGFCEGNNSGARAAKGRWLLFLNNDTWLEPDCMEKLIAGTEKLGAVASTPLVLNYPDNSYQDFGFYGFDLFGLPSPSAIAPRTREIFIAGGCSYLIRADVFNQLGMFDAEYFIYSDDADLSWRVWLAGYKVAGIFEAKLHHRGAAGVNPSGGITTVEFRTNDRKRFLTNRNCLLTLLKNGQHILLLPLIPLIALLFLESLAGASAVAALVVCAGQFLERAARLLAAARPHFAAAKNGFDIPQTFRLLDAALLQTAIEPLGRNQAHDQIRPAARGCTIIRWISLWLCCKLTR